MLGRRFGNGRGLGRSCRSGGRGGRDSLRGSLFCHLLPGLYGLGSAFGGFLFFLLALLFAGFMLGFVLFEAIEYLVHHGLDLSPIILDVAGALHGDDRRIIVAVGGNNHVAAFGIAITWQEAKRNGDLAGLAIIRIVLDEQDRKWFHFHGSRFLFLGCQLNLFFFGFFSTIG